MQRDRFVAARTWIDNARVDLALAAEIAERFPSRACFHAQQAAELALKAALIAVADDHPRTHIGDVLVGELADLGIDVPVAVVEAANRLDLFYMGSRYPDALAGADPLKVLQADDARARAPAAAASRLSCWKAPSRSRRTRRLRSRTVSAFAPRRRARREQGAR